MKFQVIKVDCFVKETKRQLKKNEVYYILSDDIKDNNFYYVKKTLFPLYIDALDKHCKHIYVIVNGGIGDVLMQSSISEHFKDVNVTFIVTKSKMEAMKWFKNKVNIIDISGPLLTDFNMHNKLTKYKNHRMIASVPAFLHNNEADWYEIMYRQCGFKNINPDVLRPFLSTKRISKDKSNIKDKNALLIINRASSMLRSMPFLDVYNSLSDEIKDKYTIYAYKGNLTDDELKMPFKDVCLIEAKNTTQFLLDLYDAKEVITVDTSATHFREGIQKHAVCLFNSFPKEIRTKHYKYVDSFNIKSNCNLQFCTIHETTNYTICPKVKEWQHTAPCFQSNTNKTLIKQLKTIFNNYL